MGQLVLEALDLIADCRNGTLAPRPSGRADPDPAASIARRPRRRQRVTKPQIGNAAVGPGADNPARAGQTPAPP